ncbi:MAG: hypothetical protein J6Z79_00775 [Clostridia bacterium]|nr:hypothetical protein [Clostridia bacterium]
MENNIEYQIMIGCNDPQRQDEIVNERELKEILSLFFTRNKIDFSILDAKGGYLHEDGRFIAENTLCVNIIGASDLDIFKLAKNLSMFMNQECVLIVRNALKTEIR